jgi:hypothetical protein
MRQQLRRIGCVLLVALAFGSVAHAQRAHIGAHGSYNFDVEDFGIGAQFYVPVGRHLEVYPSFDYYFVDVGSLWQLNGDLKYKLREEHNWFYLGGGLALARRSAGGFSDTDVGANLLGGFETLIWKKVHPYLEGRLTLRENTTFQLAAGLNFTIY